VFRRLALAAAVVATGRAEDVSYPPGSGFFNVRDYGAKGDGATDDTAAFKKAIKAVQMHFQIIYVPNGTYLVTDTINWDAWITLQGQSRDKTVIQLKDNASFSKPVIRCMFNNNMSFSNYIRNLTVDTGKGNPGATGIRFNAHNHGVCEDVLIRSGDGKGKIGLDMAETEFGPGMARNVAIEGFDVGIKTPGNCSSAVLEHITLKNQNVVGLENNFPLSLRDLKSVNKVPAVRNTGHPMALLVLVDADLTGGSPDSVAIENKGKYYVRNVKCAGYKAVMADGAETVAGSAIDDRFNGDQLSGFASPKRHLNLPVKETPPVFDEPVSKWVVPDASAEDDTKAVQAAIDSGAATICLPSNVQYMISDTIVVRGNVRRIIALKHHHGNLRAIRPEVSFANKPMLRIEGAGKEPVTIESLHISAWPTNNAVVELASARPVYLKYVWSSAIRTTAASTGDVFLDEGGCDLQVNPGQNMWLRQWNPENNPFDPRNPRLPRTYIINKGANLWVLGLKTEAPAIHVVTIDGGKSEILGGFFRDHFGPSEYSWKGNSPVPGIAVGPKVPYFITRDASVSATYLSYGHAPGKNRDLQGIEVRGAERKEVVAQPYIVGLYNSIPENAPSARPAR